MIQMVHVTKSAQFEENLLAMNEALVLGSLRQHELAETADNLNKQLLKEISERKRAQETLRESEERFRTLFELGPIGVYSCDASGTIRDFNRRAIELWGRQPALGDPAERFCGSFKLFRPDGSFLSHSECPMADVLTSKMPEVRDTEVILERPDGSRLTVVVNIRPLRNQKGEITGAVNCFYDITERLRSEAAINASEAQYRTLFNSIDEGFCIIEKIDTGQDAPVDFRFLEANPAFERQTGVTGLVGKSIREAFPGAPQEWTNTYDAILRDGEPIRFERDLVAKGRVLEVNAFRLEDAGQRRLAVISQDITGRKNAEKIAQQLAAIVKSSDDAILSTNIDGIITSWNRGAELLFGYGVGEATGKHITILIPPDQQAKEPGMLGLIRNGHHINHFETVWMRKDGSEVWVSLSVSPLRDAEGDVIGASKIIRDMTERRLADEHRAILVGELNHRAKNSLAMVRAIASQTLGNALSLADAQLAFESRLGALARGHDLLTLGNWAGTDLASVVKATVEPHGGGENRFHIEGPFVPLTPAMALTFTMALHELCTNAAKYGALLTANGHVSIVWHVTGTDAQNRLRLLWTEQGGPPVTPSMHKGFGSRLIERALAMELSGDVSINYEPSGVVCIIDAPLPTAALKVN
jgi:two-component system, chemotaxis family, CheB/CheR fusion protein